MGEQLESGRSLIAAVLVAAGLGLAFMVATQSFLKAPLIDQRPTPGVVATTVAPKPPTSLSGGRTVVTLPDCGYALPQCVRLEGKQWFLINDYQGDKHLVTLIRTEVRGSVVYRTVSIDN